MPRILSLVAFSCLLSPVLADDHWPAFRGPNGDGVSSAKGLPTTWSEKENVVWKTAIPGKAWASPVVWGDRIWLSNAPADGKTLSVVGVDRDSGKIVHDLVVFDNPKPAFCIETNSHASSTPVVEDGRLYLHYGSAGTACLDTKSMKILWSRRDLPCNHFRGAGSSPIVWKNLLILTFDGSDLQYLAALDKETGKTVWKKDRNIKYPKDDGDWKKAYSTPGVVEIKGKPVLVSPSAEQTIAYDPSTGDELWRFSHGGMSMNASARPVFGHDRFYTTSGLGNKLFAVDLQGKTDWTITRGVPSRTSLVLLGDLLFMVTDQQGVASCVEAKTGKQMGQTRLGGNFFASPVCADGKVYFSESEKGNTYVVEANGGLKLLATNKLDEGCMASPAISGKAIYLRTRTHLYRIENK